METAGLVILNVLLLILAVVFSPLFWILVAIIGYQYVKMMRLKEYLFGVKDWSALRMTAAAFGLGIAGGLAGSLLSVLLGITVPESGYLILLAAAVLLMLINPRFLCFSYAGGLLSVSALLWGYPAISVPHLMALVAVLHLIESLLIRISGHLDPLPVYTYTRFNRPAGGFNLQKFWPIPLVVMTVSLSGDVTHGIAMPEWWPLLKPPLEAGDAQDLLFGMVPAVVGLGYGEIALASTAYRRSRLSSRNLFIYSLALLGISVAASYFSPLQWAAALFAPLGHEVVIAVAQRQEMERSPCFVPPPRGVMLLDVLRPSPASRAGLVSGDVILEVEGIPVNSRQELEEMLRLFYGSLSVRFWRPPWEEGEEHAQEKMRQGDAVWRESQVVRLERQGREPLGLIPVPGYGGEQYLDFRAPDYLGWLQRLLARWQR